MYAPQQVFLLLGQEVVARCGTQESLLLMRASASATSSFMKKGGGCNIGCFASIVPTPPRVRVLSPLPA